MQQVFFMRQQVFVYLGLVLFSYSVSGLLALFIKPAPLANILGFLALLCYIATLIPSIIKAVFPNTKKNKFLVWLLKYRRHLGVAAFCFGLNHGALLIIKLQLNFLDWHTWIKYCQGVSTLLIFTILASTSHDEAVKQLKTRWKKLHQLTYLTIFILPWHILDKMAGHWTYLTPVGVLLTVAIAILFMIRQHKSGFNLLHSNK